MAINQRLINVDFNSYRLGRFLSADHEHSANFAAAPLRAIRVDDAAAFGLPAGALVPLAVQAPALRRNRLVATRAEACAASSTGASASSSQFYCVDADGVRSIPSGQTVFAFDASHASVHSGIAMSAARDSQLLVVTHGSSNLTVVDTSTANRIAFSSALSISSSFPNQNIVPAFAVECAAFIPSSSSSLSSTALSSNGGRLLVLLSSVRIARQSAVESDALSSHSVPESATAAAMGDESSSAAALRLHPIVFENATTAETFSLGGGSVFPSHPSVATASTSASSSSGSAASSSASASKTDAKGVRVQVPAPSSLIDSRPRVSYVLCIATLFQAQDGSFVLEKVSDLLEGQSDLQDAAFSDDGHSITLVAASPFGRTAAATSDSSSSKGSQQQGAGKMESRAPSSGASDEAIADADGDDVDPALLVHFTSDKVVNGNEHLRNFGGSEDPDDAVDDEDLKAVCCARFSVATLELLAKQTVSHMPLVCSAHVYNDAAASAAGKHMIVGLKYDVDLCIFRVPDSADASSSSSSSSASPKLQLIHEHTFSALAYVAAGKRHKKFVAVGPSGLHCAIGEHSGYVFAYEHESLSGSSSSSSSSSSSAAAKSNNARQQIVRLPEGERLLGLMLVDAGMMVLTESAAAFYRFDSVE